MFGAVSARPRVMGRCHAGRASEYIRSFKALALAAPSPLKVVLYLRVSSGPQEDRGNLIGQEEYCLRKLRQHGAIVLATFREVGSGRALDARPEFARACLKAKNADAIVVACSVDRFLRNEWFHSFQNPDARPTDEDYAELLSIADSAALATIVHPNTLPQRVRGIQSKYGQKAKGNRGGRPAGRSPGYKKQRRLSLLPLVTRMRKDGASLGEIARKTGVKRSTVQDWLSRESAAAPF